MVWKYDGRQIRVGRVWTDNDGTMHSGRWANWDADRKEAMGVTTIVGPTNTQAYTEQADIVLDKQDEE